MLIDFRDLADSRADGKKDGLDSWNEVSSADL